MSNVARIDPPSPQIARMMEQSAMVSMIERVALDPNASLDKLERMLAMKERLDAQAARKAFDLAMSAAKAEIPPIVKNREVDFTGKTGIRTHYKHEDLAEIARTIDPILSAHGLSYRFRTSQDAGRVTVTCIVSHRDGHFEENTLSGGADESGNKNPLQAVASAISYLSRYALKAALGLASSMEDDDGKKAAAGGTISADQFRAIRELMDRSGADEGRFVRHFRIEALHDLPVARYGEADAMLRRKLAEKEASQ